jgi:site-specific recombinase XerD
MKAGTFAPLLQGFFTERLLKQQGVSPHTVASYRDTFRLLLRFASDRLGIAPTRIAIEAFTPALLGDFLRHLEVDRGNSIRTRNGRLSALRAFFRYVTMSEPALALQCQQVLAVPAKRYEHPGVAFLDGREATALVAAPDTRTWIGRRDRVLLQVAIQTGMRNTEITSLRWQNVTLGIGGHVQCLGKGRKTRCTPLRPDVVESLQQWFVEQKGTPNAPVFPSSKGGPLSADALQALVGRHAATACESCPTFERKHVTPHTLRHTAAMDLLRRGVDLSVIALWLGHESSETTQIYLHADMAIKEKALAHATVDGSLPGRYQPPDTLLAFLEGL